VAIPENYYVIQGSTINTPAPGVLANDSDADGDVLQAVLGASTSRGSLTLNADGSFAYTHTGAGTESDSFTYRAFDGTTGYSAVVTVTIFVGTVTNDPPTANNDAYSVDEGATLTVDAAGGVLANDTDPEGDALTAILDLGPMHGTLDLDPYGSFTYTADPGYTGTDSFTYVASDGVQEGNIATVTITVNAETGGRVTDGLVVLYDFGEGSDTTVHDISGVGTPLDLTIQTGSVSWLSGGGLSVNSSTVIRSAASAGKVISALKASNAFTIEAWIKPANTTQSGPARIVSCSSGPTAVQNFMIGAGTWGSNPSNVIDVRLFDQDMATPAGTLNTNLTHVVYTRSSAGSLSVYINGVQQLSTTLPGSLSVWNDSYALVLGNEPTGNRPWLGEFHLVAIYDRALTQEEVNQNLTAGF
jgi:VCBS repeat-containing protein